MTYQDALEKAIQPFVAMGAKPEEARKGLDACVQMNIDYRNYTASKGNERLAEPCLKFLCDLKEGKTTEDRDNVIVPVVVGDVEHLKSIGVITKNTKAKGDSN